MFLLTIFWSLVSFWSVANIYVAYTMSASEMCNEFVTGQSHVGAICANGFYSLAWLFKFLKVLIK